jgi:hypothetical protein
MEDVEWQKEVISAYRETNDNIIVAAPRGVGKTFLLGFIGHDYAESNPGSKVGFFVGSMSECRRIIRHMVNDLGYGYISEGFLKHENGAKIFIIPDTDYSRCGSRFDLILLDEWAHLRYSREIISRSGNTGRIIGCSTPFGRRAVVIHGGEVGIREEVNHFYEVWHGNGFKKFHIQPEIIEGVNTTTYKSVVPWQEPEHYDDALRMMGLKAFAQEMLAEFENDAEVEIS